MVLNGEDSYQGSERQGEDLCAFCIRAVNYAQHYLRTDVLLVLFLAIIPRISGLWLYNGLIIKGSR